MKRLFKSGLSLVLALTIVLSSALLGLGEIDFGAVFAVKASAASESDLTFVLNDDGKSYSVTDCDGFASGELAIPSTYKGLPVTSIANSAFKYCESLTSVTIPDSVISIGSGAFSGCTRLTSVTIPDSVTSIGSRAFYYCTSLTSITIPNSVTSIGGCAFYGCTSLTSITIPDSVTSIGDGAFYDCVNLTTLTIADGVIDIGDYAFSNCESLVEIFLPDTIESIGEMAFVGTGYYRDDNNWENGVLYLGDYLLSGNSSIGVYDMGDEESTCFEYDYDPDFSDGIVEFYIKDGTSVISSNAFCGYWNAISITIPNSIKRINYMAFSYFDDLKYVFYGGTESDKSDIIIDSRNEGLESAVWHYETKTHTSSDWIIDKNATCTEDGSKHKECTVCGEVIETAVISKTGHKSSNWITDINATVDAAGSKHKECTVCYAVLERETIPQLKCAAPKLTKVESTGSGVKVTWGKTSGANSYNIYRKTYSNGKWSGWSTIKTGATGTTYTDTTAKSGVYYIYTVRAKNEVGLSGYNSTGLKIKFLATPKLSSISNGSGKVTVKWSKVTGASSYTVYRKTYSNGKWSGWSKIGTTKNTYYNDAKVSSGKYYKYTVRATSGDYISYYNTSGLKIKYLAVAPLKSAVSQKAGVKVTWGKVTGAKGYEVYRKTYSKGKWSGWTKIKTISSGSTVSYTDKTAKKGVTYKFTVRAISDSNKGYYNTSGLQVKDKY